RGPPAAGTRRAGPARSPGGRPRTWRTPPRTQRRMTDWCKDGRLTRDSAVASARRAARRAGLFVSGDLAEALGRVASDEGIAADLLGGPDGLERLCEKSKAASDLVRLATDPVYAHLRWRTDVRRSGSGMTRRVP